MNTLHRVPNSVLIMMTLGPNPQAYILKEALFYGIHPDRLIFLPKVSQSLRTSSHCHVVGSCRLIGGITSTDHLAVI
jgi:predicted O-linked N-acetylglucosamine transferase (SPINDLY family)